MERLELHPPHPGSLTRMDVNAAHPTALSRRARIARVLLLLPLPLLAFMLMSLPLPTASHQWRIWAVLLAELVLAAGCFIGLGRGRRWGWTLAIALGVLATGILVTRAIPALVAAGRGQGSVALLLAVILSAGTQAMLAAAGLLAGLSRRAPTSGP